MIENGSSSNTTFASRVLVILLVVASVRLPNAVIPDVEIVTEIDQQSSRCRISWIS